MAKGEQINWPAAPARLAPRDCRIKAAARRELSRLTALARLGTLDVADRMDRRAGALQQASDVVEAAWMLSAAVPQRCSSAKLNRAVQRWAPRSAAAASKPRAKCSPAVSYVPEAQGNDCGGHPCARVPRLLRAQNLGGAAPQAAQLCSW